MRIFLWLVVLLATAIGLAVMARFNAGNVVLFYPPYRVDLSLNFFLLLLFLQRLLAGTLGRRVVLLMLLLLALRLLLRRRELLTAAHDLLLFGA